MRQTLALRCFLAVTTCIVAGGLLADLPGQRRRGLDPRDVELEHLEYRAERFESRALGGRRHTYSVLLPAGYDDEANADERYPLVIWLHGLWENHQRFTARGGAEVLDAAIGAGEFPPVVWVCAEGDRASFWIDAAEPGRAYETMVVEDLLEHVRATYRVREEPGQCAIAGTSMGGLGALKIALKHPDRFAAVSAHSAAVLPADPATIGEHLPALRGRAGRLLSGVFGDPIDLERYRAENPIALLAEKTSDDFATLRIRFDCGSDDRYGFAATNLLLHELLDERGIEHEWKLVEKGRHGWGSGYNQRALPEALAFLARCFAEERGLSGLSGMSGLSGASGAGEGAEQNDGDDGGEGDAGKRERPVDDRTGGSR